MKKIIIIVLCLVYSTTSFSQKNVNYKTNYFTDTIQSKYLKEDRIISIYFPKNYSNLMEYPVIFATDGQIITDGKYNILLDSIIENKIIPPIILIGIYSNEKPATSNSEYRNYEYIESWSNKKDTILGCRFENHLSFFIKEVIQYIENQYSVTKNRENRMFYGCSNGAGFGITLLFKHPELFSNYLCFSPCY